MQQIVLTLIAGGDGNAADLTQPYWLEASFSRPGRLTMDQFDARPSPRMIKTHAMAKDFPCLPAGDGSIVPAGTKIITVVRDPRDTGVSYFHHCCKLEGYSGPWEHFAELFVEGQVPSCGDYFEYHEGWWEQYLKLGSKQMLWVHYEDMQADLAAVVRQVADFMGLAVSDRVIADTVEGAQFESMSEQHKSSMPPGFFRKGQIGDGIGMYSEAIMQRMHTRMEQHLRHTPMFARYGFGADLTTHADHQAS
jgi:hypothetical protein